MKKKLLGLAMEQAIIFFFRNFTYTFGGRIFLQSTGGPIGARITMAVSKLVMQDFSECCRTIFENSALQIWFLGRYVDDGRQGI